MRAPRTLAALASGAALLLALALSACDQAGVLTAHDGAEVAAASKGGSKPPGGGGTATPDSHVRITVADGAGVSSDGDGAYVGGEQGVRAKIFYHDGSLSRTGGLAFGPQQDARTRSLTVTIDGQTYANVAPYITIAGLMQVGAADVDGWIAEGNSAGNADPRGDGCDGTLPCAFTGGTATVASTGIPDCGTLRFSGLTVTRTAGSHSPYGSGIKWNRSEAHLGRWEITGEQAFCEYQTGKGKNVQTHSTPVSVPLHLVVEELLPG